MKISRYSMLEYNNRIVPCFNVINFTIVLIALQGDGEFIFTPINCQIDISGRALACRKLDNTEDNSC